MKNDIKKMLQIYQTYDRDWMGYEITKNSQLTRHHIFKKVYWEINDITNYALLLQVSHQYLHILEYKDYEAYNELNKLFRELNDSMKPPTEEYYDKVGKILKRTYKKNL